MAGALWLSEGALWERLNPGSPGTTRAFRLAGAESPGSTSSGLKDPGTPPGGRHGRRDS